MRITFTTITFATSSMSSTASKATTDCLICCESFPLHSLVHPGNCTTAIRHEFCSVCLLKWIKGKYTCVPETTSKDLSKRGLLAECPMCRAPIQDIWSFDGKVVKKNEWGYWGDDRGPGSDDDEESNEESNEESDEESDEEEDYSDGEDDALYEWPVARVREECDVCHQVYNRSGMLNACDTCKRMAHDECATWASKRRCASCALTNANAVIVEMESVAGMELAKQTLAKPDVKLLSMIAKCAERRMMTMEQLRFFVISMESIKMTNRTSALIDGGFLFHLRTLLEQPARDDAADGLDQLVVRIYVLQVLEELAPSCMSASIKASRIGRALLSCAVNSRQDPSLRNRFANLMTRFANIAAGVPTVMSGGAASSAAGAASSSNGSDNPAKRRHVIRKRSSLGGSSGCSSGGC